MGLRSHRAVVVTALAYLRVSREEAQSGSYSLTVQRDQIKGLASRLGLTIADDGWFVDDGVSGGVPIAERTAGAKLVERLQSGPDRTVLALRTDRVFRDTTDALTTIDAWTRQGVSLYLSDTGERIDANVPLARLMFTLSSAVAEHERRMTAQRVRQTKQARKANGRTYAPRMFGWDHVDGRRVENAREQAVIKQVMSWRQAGESLREIAERLNRSRIPTVKGKPWAAQTVSDVIQRAVETDKGSNV